MRKVDFEEAARSGRTLVFHYIGVYYPSLTEEFDELCCRLQYWPANFQCVAAVDCTDAEEAFRCTQDWEGGRSTCGGDLVRTPDGKWWLCRRMDWQEVTSVIQRKIHHVA